MLKYIISSGKSVVAEIIDKDQFEGVKVSNDSAKAISFNTIGEAIKKAIKVNNILGTNAYKAIGLEIN